MKEIGGYIELDRRSDPMLYEDGIHLNCGRNALAYLIEARRLRAIVLPVFNCDSVTNLCKKYGVNMRFYSITQEFLPEDVRLEPGEWLYLVNAYGQLRPEQLTALAERYGRVIVDNAQAYFAPPLPGMDTLYTCRKFFGVPDGAILYTDVRLEREIPTDVSHDRMRFLLGRTERPASEFYPEYVENNRRFQAEEIKFMSPLTELLLHNLDYEAIKKKRTENFSRLHERLRGRNQLHLRVPEGAFAYPLMLKEAEERKKALIQARIYIPTLWPNVLRDAAADSFDLRMARDVLPIPCDQRYSVDDMDFICEKLEALSGR